MQLAHSYSHASAFVIGPPALRAHAAKFAHAERATGSGTCGTDCIGRPAGPQAPGLHPAKPTPPVTIHTKSDQTDVCIRGVHAIDRRRLDRLVCGPDWITPRRSRTSAHKASYTVMCTVQMYPSNAHRSTVANSARSCDH